MKRHRLDPFSLVLGIAGVAFGGMLLFTDPTIADVRPARLWPIPLLIVGVMLAIAGVQRAMASARDDAPTPEPVDDDRG